MILLQTQEGPDTVYRWAEIIQTVAVIRSTDATTGDSMSIAAPAKVQASEPNQYGYREFKLGEFTFSRDEYFAYVEWPTGRHVMSADAFLRALQRDVAWQFFYGIVNFDGVIGTVNHYGTVDLFAGRYNDAYRKAELDHLENFETPADQGDVQGDARRLDERGLRPLRQPDRDRAARSASRTATTAPRSPATGSPPQRMVSVPGDEALRTDANGHPINRQFADVPQDEPEIDAEPGFEDEVAAFNLFAYLSRSPVTWNPSVVSVCGDSLYCPTTEEYILPIIHGNDRVEWFVQLSDEIIWDVEDRDTGAARAKVVDAAGRRRGDAGRHPPPGLRAEAVDAAGLGERRSGAARPDLERPAAVGSGRVLIRAGRRASPTRAARR